jgi:hypothetical protein
MATIGGPNIDKKDLVYYIDFLNSKCYSTPGTVISGLGDTVDSTYIYNNGKLIFDPAEGTLYRNAVNDGRDYYKSDTNVLLGSDFTMHAFVKVTGCTTSANGILTNHNHVTNSGAGITIRRISATDFRISCNTGSGTSRTFYSYYGVTNIYNTWAFLTLRFIGSSLTLWVNDNIEYTGSYSQYNESNTIDIFNWSTAYASSNNYRPAFRMSMASVYNRALTNEEITQNYNAIKSRFGL